MARVAVVFTGGTISTAFDPVAGGNVPALDGAAILARTPGLDAIAEVVAIDRGRTPASHFTFPALLEIAGVAPRGAGRPGDRRRGRRPGHRHDRGDRVLLGPRPRRGEAGRRDRRDARVGRGRLRRAGQPARRGPGRGGRRRCAAPGVVVCLAGTIEPADDVVKMHASALDTFAQPERRLARPGRGRRGRAVPATGRPTARRDRRGPPSGSTSSPRPSRWTARCWTPRSPPARTGSSWPPRAPGTPDPALLAAARTGDRGGHPGRAGDPLSGGPGRRRLRVPGRRRDVDPGRGAAGRPPLRGQGPGRAGARARGRPRPRRAGGAPRRPTTLTPCRSTP